MNIIFFETTKEEESALSALVSGVDCTFVADKLNVKTVALYPDAEIISTFIGSEISKEVIDALPKLKFISTRSTGYDHIDVEYAKSKAIAVSNVPSYGSHTIAEFTFALMLDLSRKVSDANRQIRQDGSYDISRFRGFDLFGKTLGVIGTGKIGKNVIKIAKGFGMNVIAFDVFPDEKFASEVGFTYMPLADLLASSDVITIHTLYNKDTYHLINKDNVKLIKKGAYLINTARGEIVDTEALVWALQQKIIAGAGLDVLEGERKLKEESNFILNNDNNATDQNFKNLIEDHMLMDMPNVIVTPHIAFSSREAETEIAKISAENVLAFIKGTVINSVIK